MVGVSVLIDYWPLTERHETILMMLADGFTQREIGEELGISWQTVRWHTGRLRERLGAHTNCQAVAIAYHHGVLKPMVPA